MKKKKPFYQRWWFILIMVIVVISLASSIRSGIKKASDQKSKYTWPDNSLVSLIPQPKSKYGKINIENEDCFLIDIYKVSNGDYEKYVEDCKSRGFTVDYNKYDNMYTADNDEGYSLSITYNEKEKILGISLYAPDESSSEKEYESDSSSEPEQKENEDTDQSSSEFDESEVSDIDESNKTSETSNLEDESGNENENNDETESGEEDIQSQAEASDDIRPELKQVLDDYEAFMGDYCEFMKKYSDSDDTYSMTNDYLKLMKEEVEWAEKINKLEDTEMNDAETKYYIDVTARVSKMLLEVGQ